LAAAAEQDLIQEQREDGGKRPKQILAEVGLPPTDPGDLEPKARPGIGKPLEGGAAFGFFFDPGGGGGVEILPQFGFVIPDQAPGMGISLAHDEFAAA